MASGCPKANSTHSNLWMQAMGLRTLPRLLLTDRDGILRADCGPKELEERVSALMKDTSEKDK